MQGDEITIDPACGFFLTLNPEPRGRSELPEGLKALFRPIAVTVPDFNVQLEQMLMGGRVAEWKALSRKFAVFCELCKDLLPKAHQRHWGIWTMMSALDLSSTLQFAHPSLPKEALMMKYLRDTNVATFDGDDREQSQIYDRGSLSAVSKPTFARK